MWSIAFSVDGQTLVSGGGGLLRIWDAASLTPRAAVQREALGLVRFTTQKVGSLADCRDRIARCATCPQESGSEALALVDGYWAVRGTRSCREARRAAFADGRLHDEAEQVAPKTRRARRECPGASARGRCGSGLSLPTALNDASWNVAREQGRDASDYLLALHRARRRAGTIQTSAAS